MLDGENTDFLESQSITTGIIATFLIPVAVMRFIT